MDPQVFDRQYLIRELYQATKDVGRKGINEWDTLPENKRAMHDAVKSNNVNMIKFLLDNGINVDIRDTSTGYTPLHVAIKQKYHSIARLLLKNGADINKVTKSGVTTLHLAFETQDENMVFLIIANGANINIKMLDKSPLYLAVKLRMFDVVNLLLKKRCDVNDITTVDKIALHATVEAQYFHIVNLLLTYNARTDLKLLEKCPLSLTIENNSYEIALLLLHMRMNDIFYCRDVHAAMYLAFQMKDMKVAYAFMEYHINPNWRMEQKSLLHLAVEYEWEDIVMMLLEKGADSSVVTSDNVSALHAALEVNNKTIVKSLLEYGADVNVQCEFSGDTPLHLAVKNNCLKSVRILLEKGANPNAINNQCFTPLHLAFDLGYRNIICHLLAFNGDLMVPKHGMSLLEIAVEYQWQDLVQQLMREGADANAIGSKNVSMLIMAVKRNNTEIIQQLLRYGADIHVRDEQNDMTPLQFAVVYSHISIVKFLLQRGADVNYTTFHGVTALTLALAKQYDRDMVMLLLEYGAMVNIGDLSEQLILNIAVEHDWVEITRMMIVQGADVNQSLYDFFKSLSSAITISKTYLADLLSSYVMDIYKKAICGYTLLYIAASHSSVEMVELLLKHGAVVDSSDYNKLNPLFIALKRRDERMISMLIESGCSINTQNQESGQTPLHLAVLYGYTNVISLMLAKGADVEIKDNDGRTPLECAVSCGDINTTKLLLRHEKRTTEWKNNLYISLVCAVRLQDYEMVELLLSKRPRLVYYEEPDETALGVAVCETTNFNILRLLLDYDQYESKMQLDVEDILCHVGHIAKSMPAIAEMLVQHVATKDLRVETPDDWESHSIPDNMRDHYEDCLIEIKEMKKDTFYNNVSFYTILTKHPKRLAIMLRNHKILERFWNSNYEVKYPIFKDSLRYYIEKAVVIVDRTIAAETALINLTKYNLPHYVMQNILTYLSDADFQSLLTTYSQVFEPLSVNEDM